MNYQAARDLAVERVKSDGIARLVVNIGTGFAVWDSVPANGAGGCLVHRADDGMELQRNVSESGIDYGCRFGMHIPV